MKCDLCGEDKTVLLTISEAEEETNVNMCDYCTELLKDWLEEQKDYCEFEKEV